MSSVLLSIRKILVTVTFVLLSILLPTLFDLRNPLIYIIYGGMVIIFILLLKEIFGKGKLFDDLFYNLVNDVGMLYILIVVLRSILDKNIIANTYEIGKNMLFYNYNSIFILIIVMGLLIYSILKMIGEKKNDRHKHTKKR
jgi:hypothetical protein